MVFVGFFLATVLSGLAVITDNRTYKISNRLIGAGMLLLLVYLVICMFFWGATGGFTFEGVMNEGGMMNASEGVNADLGMNVADAIKTAIRGISSNVGAFFVTFGLMFAVYAIGGIGAGDVKLLSIIGGFVGMEKIGVIIVLSFVLAAVYGLLVICRKPAAGLHKIHFSYAIFAAVVLCTAMAVSVY